MSQNNVIGEENTPLEIRLYTDEKNQTFTIQVYSIIYFLQNIVFQKKKKTLFFFHFRIQELV